MDKGYREVTLLGQNVDSYSWKADDQITTFPELIERVALIDPLLRIRFSTSHPKDMSDELLGNNVGTPQYLQTYSSSCAKRKHQDTEAHEPGIYTRMVYGQDKCNPFNYTGMFSFDGYHNRILHRDRRGPPGDSFAYGVGRI